MSIRPEVVEAVKDSARRAEMERHLLAGGEASEEFRSEWNAIVYRFRAAGVYFPAYQSKDGAA